MSGAAPTRSTRRDSWQNSFSALITALEDASSNVMDIFYVAEPAREKIIHVLKQWREPPVEIYTTAAIRRMIVEQSDAQDEASCEDYPTPKYVAGQSSRKNSTSHDRNSGPSGFSPGRDGRVRS
ncbi:unnamed protein product, partial [Clonostachys byssicola]